MIDSDQMSFLVALIVIATSVTAANLRSSQREHESMTSDGGTRSMLNDARRNDAYKCNERQPVIEYYDFRGLQYMFFSEKLTWEEADLRCGSYDGKLAILDDVEKAGAVAKTMAESNIGSGDKWIGGRRLDGIWFWIDRENNLGDDQAIPTASDADGYPLWSRAPFRPFKECLGIDRHAHDSPSFVDLDCRLRRPFVCEKLSDSHSRQPLPAKWIQTRGSMFVLYHAKFTWEEAASFCGSRGSRLAVVKSNHVVNVLANGMSKTRPDFENAWIGARHSYGRWAWLSTGTALKTDPEENGYPPWRYEGPERNEGCLLLDRHLENRPNFVEMACDRRRDFICEEYEDDQEDWSNDALKFNRNNVTYVLYPEGKNWHDSEEFCLQQGSVLSWLENINDTNAIVDAMSDHPKEIAHIWLGGKRSNVTGKWIWSRNEQPIPTWSDETGFPPWSKLDRKYEYYDRESTCLNLDRSNHVAPYLYGLDCDTKQSFVCTIACDIPPPIKNGLWICRDASRKTGPTITKCELTCNHDHLILGSPNVTCSPESGWSNTQGWLEFPTCHSKTNYAKLMVNMMAYEMKRSRGYYLLVDTVDRSRRQLSMSLAEGIQKHFPISHNLKMGMLSAVSTPPVFLPLNQTNACQMLGITRFAMQHISDDAYRINDAEIYRELWRSNKQKFHFIAILDSTRISIHSNLLKQLKEDGQRVTVIGHPNDQTDLQNLASVGFNRRTNMFLLNNTELQATVDEINRFDKGLIRCNSMSFIKENSSLYDTFGSIGLQLIASTSQSTTEDAELFSTAMQYFHSDETSGPVDEKEASYKKQENENIKESSEEMQAKEKIENDKDTRQEVQLRQEYKKQENENSKESSEEMQAKEKIENDQDTIRDAQLEQEYKKQETATEKEATVELEDDGKQMSPKMRNIEKDPGNKEEIEETMRKEFVFGPKRQKIDESSTAKDTIATTTGVPESISTPSVSSHSETWNSTFLDESISTTQDFVKNTFSVATRNQEGSDVPYDNSDRRVPSFEESAFALRNEGLTTNGAENPSESLVGTTNWVKNNLRSAENISLRPESTPVEYIDKEDSMTTQTTASTMEASLELTTINVSTMKQVEMGMHRDTTDAPIDTTVLNLSSDMTVDMSMPNQTRYMPLDTPTSILTSKEDADQVV